MSPSLSRTMYPHPSAARDSATYLSTAPATAAMGPTSVASDAAHIHLTTMPSSGEAE